ncbi:uncharacterized protein ACIQIH_019160 isoform 1-T1 [Cyanocitta cristata]
MSCYCSSINVWFNSNHPLLFVPFWPSTCKMSWPRMPEARRCHCPTRAKEQRQAESDEDLRYHEQVWSRSLEMSASKADYRECTDVYSAHASFLPRMNVVCSSLKTKCWDWWLGEGKNLWNHRRQFEVSLEERDVGRGAPWK